MPKEKAQIRLFQPHLGAIAHFRTFSGLYGPLTDRAERVLLQAIKDLQRWASACHGQ